MASPIRPSELAALIPKGEDSICTVLVKYFKFQIKAWQIHKYQFDAYGNFTAAHIADLCKTAKMCQ